MESRNDFDVNLLSSCLDYNAETGNFHWKISTGKSKIGKRAGSVKKGYVEITYQGRNYRAHRIAWAMYHGGALPDIIDHVDGNGLNNAINNLRPGDNCINQQNQKNAHVRNKSSSKLGVSNFKGRWRAKIYHKGKYIFLGYHSTESLASEAYLKAKKQIHGGFIG